MGNVIADDNYIYFFPIYYILLSDNIASLCARKYNNEHQIFSIISIFGTSLETVLNSYKNLYRSRDVGLLYIVLTYWVW